MAVCERSLLRESEPPPSAPGCASAAAWLQGHCELRAHLRLLEAHWTLWGAATEAIGSLAVPPVSERSESRA